MSPLDAVYPPWWFYFLPAFLIILIVITIIGLVAFGYVLGRRRIITFRTGGVLAITFASILLLSGIWCVFLSPATSYTETKESFSQTVSVAGNETWSRAFNLEINDFLAGSVDGKPLETQPTQQPRFNIHIYDPNDNIVFSDVNVTYSYFNIEALQVGRYLFSVENPNPEKIDVYLHVSVRGKVTIRPLEPVGTWLSLISIPIFGLGVWAYIAPKGPTKTEIQNPLR